MRTSRLLGVAAAAVSVLAVSACSTSEAGAAAVVGDRRISVAQVQAGYQDLLPLVGQDQQITQGDILNWLILEPYLTQAAGQLGRGVSAHDAELEFSQVPNIPKPSQAGIEVLQANLATVQLQSGRSQAQILETFGQIEDRLKAAGVHVNPRYGAGIDYKTFTMQAAQQNWLKSTEAPAATPQPATPEQQTQPTPEQSDMSSEPTPTP